MSETALLPRRDRERLARRAAMLDAALVVFADKGYAGATLDEIAERAEFGKGTLYNYFPDGKDELFLTLFEDRVAAGLHRVVRAALPDAVDLATPAAARAAFRGLIADLVQHFQDQRDAVVMFMKEGHRTMPDPEKMAVFARHFDAIIDALAAPIERAIAAGAMRDLPARPVAHLIMGNVRGYIMSEVDADCTPDEGGFEPSPFGDAAAAADFITTVLFDGLLAETR